MAIGFKHGSSGGNFFNFEVLNKSSQPTDPKENTIWINTSNILNCWTYGSDMPLRRSKNKNFVTYPYASGTNTSSGVTFTDNGDGTVTVNGTATKDVYFRASKATAEEGMFLLPAGTYTLSGCPSGGSASTYMIQLVTLTDALGVDSMVDEYGSGATINLEKDTLCRMNFYVKSGANVSNLNVYFQVEAGSVKTAFEKGNANGQVWIKPNLSSTVSFDAFKRNRKGNRIILQPGECWLFRTGYGWQNYNKYTKIYQNGAWKDLWDGYFFKAGNQYTNITGGWTAEGWTSSGWSVTQQSKVNTDNLYVLGQASSMSAVGTVQKVDLSRTNALKASINQTSGTVTLCICDDKNTSNSVASKANTTTGSCEVSLDVSGYNGSYYIIIFAHGSGSEATITNVWGE
jgi:hypothetical protein